MFKAGNGAGPVGGGPSPGAIHAAQAWICNQLHRQAGTKETVISNAGRNFASCFMMFSLLTLK
jgi:hypothetical protein